MGEKGSGIRRAAKITDFCLKVQKTSVNTEIFLPHFHSPPLPTSGIPAFGFVSEQFAKHQ
jgi:hypothetical protein